VNKRDCGSRDFASDARKIVSSSTSNARAFSSVSSDTRRATALGMGNLRAGIAPEDWASQGRAASRGAELCWVPLRCRETHFGGAAR
jgi:hypothetical protein